MKKLFIGMLIILMISIATVSANPILDLIGNKQVNEGTLLEFNITCSPPDSGSTSFSTDAGFGSLTKYNETLATFSWTPGYDKAGNYNVEFNVSDANSSDSRPITITVINTNRAPVWTGNIPTQTVNEDSALFLVGNVNTLATDPDANTLTFSISIEDRNKVDCTIDSDGTDLKIQPAADFYGTATCTIRARDNGQPQLYAENNLTVIVNPVEDAPAITSTAKTSAYINTAYSYNVQAGDVDGDTLSYSLLTAPDKMTIDSSSGQISWTPNATGDYNVVVEATDGKTPVTQSYTVTVDYPLKLEIDDIDVWVDGKSDDSAGKSGGTIDNKVRPQSQIKMKVKLKNAYSSSDDIDITDITVNGIIYGLDEDEDIEKEEDVDDIGPGKTKTIYLTFDVPLRVDAGEYDMTLTISASDDRRDYDIQIDYIVEVTKLSHNIKISEAVLTPEKLTCSRNSNLNVEIMNIGSSDEDSTDNIKLTIYSSQLSIDFMKSKIELDSDIDSENNVHQEALSISLPDNFAPGIYPIKIDVFRSTNIVDTKEAQLTVEACSLTQTQQQTTQQSGGDQNVQVNTGANLDVSSGDLPPEFAGYTIADAAEETSFTNSGWYVAILVIVILAVVGLGVFLVIKFLIKPGAGMGSGFNY